jgi:hypothetical protein
MSDTNVEPGADRIDEVLHKFETALHGHEDLTRAELERLNRELRNALEDSAAADKREKDELRAALKETQDWIEGEKKARSERARVRQNKTTLVVPPNDTAIQQAAEPIDRQEEMVETEERSLWKRIW